MRRAATAMPVALADGRRVNVECWPGIGVLLWVLLHGLLDCAAGWKHLAQVTHRPCYAVDLPGFCDSDRPTRNRMSAYAEDVQGALAAIEVHDFTLVGHSLVALSRPDWQNGLARRRAACWRRRPPASAIRVAEAIGLPVVRSAALCYGLPLALVYSVTALGVYMAVVGNGILPDPELVARLRKNAYRFGLAPAHSAPTRRSRRRALAARVSPPPARLPGAGAGAVGLLLTGSSPPADRDGVMTAFPQTRISVWKKIGHHPQHERPSQLARFIEAACAHARRQRARQRSALQRAQEPAITAPPKPRAEARGRTRAAVADDRQPGQLPDVALLDRP